MFRKIILLAVVPGILVAVTHTHETLGGFKFKYHPAYERIEDVKKTDESEMFKFYRVDQEKKELKGVIQVTTHGMDESLFEGLSANGMRMFLETGWKDCAKGQSFSVANIRKVFYGENEDRFLGVRFDIYISGTYNRSAFETHKRSYHITAMSFNNKDLDSCISLVKTAFKE